MCYKRVNLLQSVHYEKYTQQYSDFDASNCGFCAAGSNGSCKKDAYDCISGPPWHMNGFCANDGYLGAGLNGCKNCPFMRTNCATTCNWCTPENAVSIITKTGTASVFKQFVKNSTKLLF